MQSDQSPLPEAGDLEGESDLYMRPMAARYAFGSEIT